MAPQRLSFDDVLLLNSVSLRAIGILKYPGLKKSLSNIIQRFLNAFLVGNALHLVISVTYVLIFSKYDLDILLSIMALLLSVLSGTSRYLLALYNVASIEDILEINKQIWKRARKLEDYEALKGYGLRARTLSAVLLGLGAVTAFLLALMPFFATIKKSSDLYSNSTENTTLRRPLPFPSPFETCSSPYYELIYIAQAITLCCVGMTFTIVDAMSAMLVIHGCGQFKLLNHWLLGIAKENGNSTSNHYGHEQREESLKSCLRFHRSILEYCNVLEGIVSIQNLSLMLSCMYKSSLFAFKIFRGGPETMKYVSFLILSVIQILFLCWPADSLSSESTNIAFAFYNCPWYDDHKSIRSSIQIAIARSQIPVALTAGKFVTMSLETFTSIISSAMSFFAVLKSV